MFTISSDGLEMTAELNTLHGGATVTLSTAALTADTLPLIMLMYGKEASNRKQEIDRQHYTIPNQRPKDKHCGKI